MNEYFYDFHKDYISRPRMKLCNDIDVKSKGLSKVFSSIFSTFSVTVMTGVTV